MSLDIPDMPSFLPLWTALGGCVAGFIFGVVLFWPATTKFITMEKEAIEHGVGRYDPKTGKFQWGAYDEKTKTLTWVEDAKP